MENQLLKYVEDQLAKGFKPDMIKARLVRQGYSPSLVEGVIESVSIQRNTPMPIQPAASHEKSVFTKLILILLTLGILITGVFVVPGLFREKTPLLDVKVSGDQLMYGPGEDVGFDLEVINMGSAERFDVTLLYRILDKNDISVVSKEETIAISTSTSFHKSVTLPANAPPGHYLLKVFANYNGKVATSSFSFDVAEKSDIPSQAQPSCTDGIKNQNELGIDCGGKCSGYWYDGSCHTSPKTSPGTTTPTTTKASCADNIKNQDETEIDCGGICGGYWYDDDCHASPKPRTQQDLEPTFASIMMDVRVTVKSDPDSAKDTCLGLEKADERDKCLKLVGQLASNKDYCGLIENPGYRDECYYPMFMKGDYSVCELLSDPQSLKACTQMRDISAVQAQIISAQTEEPGEISTE